ncbi:hypothetical protein [Methylogaea oryzae]|uniref:Uncharacterized protein n=1 Tax=Methylogaea oryzae TaxID=1295382 RepID=A0A8D5AJ48_9GAMM|nr:hypothetical protein [Methylogaea oryzae]BBL69676.1 hypothetical protein MoryE10_02820 [Methylogaea oryzae]
MDNLSSELQNAIRALEQVGDHAGAHSDAVDELLDQLYQQKMDLAGAPPHAASPNYKQAVEAMRAAGAKVKSAQRDKNRLADALRAVSEATAKINRVLDNAA